MKYLYKIRLVELREERGINQSVLTNLLGFKNNSFGQFEREDTILPINHLNTLANYFSVSLDYIFGFTGLKSYENSSNSIDVLKSAKRLIEFRKDNSLTQEMLANILSLTKSSISKYESGKVMISTSSIYIICEKYKISADYLLGKVDQPKYLN